MEPEQVAGIVKSLTKDERAAIIAKGGAHSVVTSERMMPLWTGITKHGAGWFSIALNSAGLAVRSALKENDRGE